MGEGGSDTAAVEVDDASALTAREDDAPVEGVAALWVEQTETLQKIARIALSREMSAQAPAGGITDPQFFDQDGIAQSSLLEIAPCLGVAIELLLIESGGLLQHGGRVSCESALLLEVGETLAEGKMTGQLDKAKEIAALTATVTVKEIFTGVDVERRAGFRMQGTKSDELGAVSDGPGGPMLLPQIIEQRKALFQFFDVLAHDAVLPQEVNVGEGRQHSQARMVGRRKFLRAAEAREFAEPESAQTTAQFGDRPDHRAPAMESCERAFGGERKGPVGSGPGRSTSDEAWRNPARG
jgi:hypothetical protein